MNTSILITGAAGGLGSVLSRGFARQGAQLMLVDKDSRGLDRLSDEIRSEGWALPGICPLDLAVAGPDEYDEVAGILAREFGGLDHLVHCAAHFGGLTPLEQVKPVDWLTSVQVNLNAVWALTVACLPLLKASGDASVTVMLDDESRSRSAYWGAYGMSKAALESFAGILGEELAGARIRVLAVNPGPMRTALRAAAYLAEDPNTQPAPEAAAGRILASILGRGADPKA